MNRLIQKGRSRLGRLAGPVVMPRLERLEASAEQHHAELHTQIAALDEHLTATIAGVRAESVELTRMLRQQGDASDEVAEILGRTLARLGAEVDALTGAVERLQTRLDERDASERASAASGVGDHPE